MDETLDARRTHYFMQVMSRGSVRGAAELLDMDPSAVSRAIAALERDCGMALFERRGRGLVPTDAGHMLARYVKRQQDIQDSFFSRSTACARPSAAISTWCWARASWK